MLEAHRSNFSQPAMLRLLLLLPSLLFVVSCGNHPAAGTAASTTASTAATATSNASASASRKSMNEKFNGPTIRQNAKGEWGDDVKQYSAFDSSHKSPYFNEKSSIAKTYKTGEYAKTEWTGKKKQLPKQAYSGSTDGDRFHTPSRIQHDGAHESSTAAVTVPDDYKTGSYKTSTAHEQGAKPIDKPSNAIVDQRRRVYPEPEVSSWKQQRSMDLKTTKSILGHDE